MEGCASLPEEQGIIFRSSALTSNKRRFHFSLPLQQKHGPWRHGNCWIEYRSWNPWIESQCAGIMISSTVASVWVFLSSWRDFALCSWLYLDMIDTSRAQSLRERNNRHDNDWYGGITVQLQ
jgi:hypothetical protein